MGLCSRPIGFSSLGLKKTQYNRPWPVQVGSASPARHKPVSLTSFTHGCQLPSSHKATPCLLPQTRHLLAFPFSFPARPTHAWPVGFISFLLPPEQPITLHSHHHGPHAFFCSLTSQQQVGFPLHAYHLLHQRPNNFTASSPPPAPVHSRLARSSISPESLTKVDFKVTTSR